MYKNNQYLFVSALLFIGLILPIDESVGDSYDASNPEHKIKVCRLCHDNPRAQKQSLLRNSTSNAHHLLQNTPISERASSEENGSAAPNARADKDGLYDCMTCHSAVMTENGPDISAIRDCLQCHDGRGYWPARHHLVMLVDSNNPHPRANPVATCHSCHIIARDFEVGASGHFGYTERTDF